MNEAHPQIREEYLRWKNCFGNDTHPAHLVTLNDALRGHYLLMDYFLREGEPIGIFGPRDPHLLPSAIHRQATGFGGTRKWCQPLDQCATLFFGLIKDHPFHDGNKRTALLMALFGMLRLQRTPTAKQREFEQLALRTAAGELERYSWFSPRADDPEVRAIAEFFRRNTRQEDKRYYVITYAELDRVLRKHGFRLDGPHDNHVTVIQNETVQGFFRLTRRTVEKKLVSIGCPRWSAQINQKALKSVLRHTGLTPENGFDSKVLFKDAESLNALIDTYRDPLRRLRDK